jgi:hypothetical protein
MLGTQHTQRAQIDASFLTTKDTKAKLKKEERKMKKKEHNRNTCRY